MIYKTAIFTNLTVATYIEIMVDRICHLVNYAPLVCPPMAWFSRIVI